MTQDPLFICDLANNHFGDIEHAKQIITEIAKVAKATETSNVAVKFQFRDFDSYIHERFKDRRDLKYIERFLQTRLNFDDFFVLNEHIRDQGLISMATPFDESGVEWCERLDVDYIKIASVSANDYPLIARVLQANKPVVASTGGLRMDEIDKLVFLFKGNVPDFTLMHCVSIYPCAIEDLNLNQILNFTQRYQDIKIGFSTHEDPNTDIPVMLSTALGAKAFERHVGIDTEMYKLNGYSSSPSQIENWINAQRSAEKVLGSVDRVPAKTEESQTLRTLKRGIYLRKNVEIGETITISDVYFAFPLETDSQFWSGEIEFPVVCKSPIETNGPVTRANIVRNQAKGNQIDQIILQAKGMLASARINFNDDATIELSHHYGLERFREMGAILVTCYNDEYAKKLVIQLPRQKHPYHFHKLKKESFQLLWGDMQIVIEGRSIEMKLGEIITVEREQWHKFSSMHGAIVEEISTIAIGSDSYYEDPAISELERHERKTSILKW
jgi:sialic acid synthase SpsE/mannose-6-phosphate isomerase-like protein (cupin superfamily)